MKIIDMRVRAPFRAYQNSNLYNPNNIGKASMRRLGAGAAPSVAQFSMALLLQEAQQMDVEKMVVPVRKALDGDNQDLADLIQAYPNNITGLAGIDLENISASLEEIAKFVVNGPCQGIILEPGQDKSPWYVNCKEAMPIYDYCEKHHIPILITYGGIMTKSLRYYDPQILDDVVAAFPKLKIGLAHGGFPYVTEVCQIALNRGNLYLAPDFYLIESPGMSDYIIAANCLLKEYFMFGSAYPIMPLKESIEYYLHCGLNESCLPLIMHDNALTFLFEKN